MNKEFKIIIIICLMVILLTLRIKKNDNTITIQFGLWQLIKDYLNR